MAEIFTCPKHNTELEIGAKVECSACVSEIEVPLPATTVERLQELRRWIESPLTVGFERIHKRTEALMDRPVWTHEFAWPDQLYAELAEGNPASINEIIEKLPPEKTIILQVEKEEE